MALRVISTLVFKNTASLLIKNGCIISKSNFGLFTVSSRRKHCHREYIGLNRVSNFSFGAMKKHYAVIPMVVISIVSTLIVVVFCSYVLLTNLELAFTREGPRFEKMNLNKPPLMKFYDVKPADRSLPEVADLLLEIERAEKGVDMNSCAGSNSGDKTK